MDFLFPYSESKLKPHLKMAVQRIQIHNNKKTTAVKIQKREVAQLLRDGKDEKAKIRAEHIIREDFTIEGLEILELILELIHERIKQISTAKETCPVDLKEAVSSVIWATNVVDVPELKEVSSQLTKKFGAKFAEAAVKNENNEVNLRLYSKLTYRPPSRLLVRKYLEEIAKTYDVEWEPNPSDFEDENLPYGSPLGSSIPMAPGSQLTGAYSRPPNSSSEPPNGGLNNVAPHLRLNEAEIAEYQQFLANQVRGGSNAPPSVHPGLNAPPPSNRGNNGHDGDGDGGAPIVGYVYNEHNIITQTEVPLVEAQVISSSVIPVDDSVHRVNSQKPEPVYIQGTAVIAPGPAPAPAPAPYVLPSPPVSAPVNNSPPPTTTTNSIPPADPPASTPPVDPLEALQARLAALNRRTP